MNFHCEPLYVYHPGQKELQLLIKRHEKWRNVEFRSNQYRLEETREEETFRTKYGTSSFDETTFLAIPSSFLSSPSPVYIYSLERVSSGGRKPAWKGGGCIYVSFNCIMHAHQPRCSILIPCLLERGSSPLRGKGFPYAHKTKE